VAPKTQGPAVPTAEDSPVSLDLDSPYQISKIVGEFYSNYYWKQHSLPVVKVRFQNVYGPGEILGAGQWRGTPATVWRNVIPTFIYRALRALPLFLEGGGAASRDFIYVDDIVNGLLLCAERGNPGDVYNLASGAETTIRELAELILGHAAHGSKIELAPGRDWDNSGKRLGCVLKSQHEIGFTARMPLPEGLFRSLRWLDEHMALIENCMARHATNIARHDTDRLETGKISRNRAPQQTSGSSMRASALREKRSIQSGS
jgi:UDP-glucose 4-epimerase